MCRGAFVQNKLNFIRSITFSAILILSVFSLAAGGATDTASSDGTITITDNYDRSIILDGPAKTVVSLAPAITETVFALGHGDALVGKTSYCNYPPEASEVPAVGTLMEPDIEAIVALSPDIVIASTHFPKEALDNLENAGQKIAVFMGQESFDGVYDGVIRPVAKVLGDEKSGEKLISSMQKTVKKAENRVAKFKVHPTVYYVVGFGEGGDWTATGDTFIGEMIEMAGGKNIAADATGWSFNLETLVDSDPDIIIIPGWASGMFETTPVYSDLTAVKEGHVYVIDQDIVNRQGPRLADGFAELVNIIGTVN
jgi:iron complex transport system substrate-binding protein